MKTKRLIILALNIVYMHNMAADSISLESLSSTLTNLQAKAEELNLINPSGDSKQPGKIKTQAEIDRKYYKSLEKTLNQDSLRKIDESLEQLNKVYPRTATRVAKHIINLLGSPKGVFSMRPSMGPEEDLVKAVSINYQDLGVIKRGQDIFVTYIMSISKIVEAIVSLHNPTDNISIFSDDFFSNPTLLFLLISSLNYLGYKSIEMNLLTKSNRKYDKLRSVLEIENFNSTINEYSTAEKLIESGNKMDIYLTNLQYPEDIYGVSCSKTVKFVDSEQSKIYLIIAEHSKQTNDDLFISTKTSNSKRQQYRNQVIDTLIEKLPLLNPQFSESIMGYNCRAKSSVHTTLADIVYATQRSNSKKIPLFTARIFKQDTGSGNVRKIAIIETLLNFGNYTDLFAAILKTQLALETDQFAELAKDLQLFDYDKDNKKIELLIDDLNNIKSDIKVFIRNRTIISPTKTDIP